MARSGAERVAAWRERRRDAGLSIHPERQRAGFVRTDKRPRTWLFIDTEGGNDPDGVYGDPGRQWTMLITAADSAGNAWHLYTGRPLSTEDMLWFILRLPRKQYKFGGYFFQYDIDQLTHDLTEDNLRRLYGSVTEPGRPVLHTGFVISKFNTQLTIAKPMYELSEPPDDMKGFKAPRRVIWDVGKFYQAKLSTAIENWRVATDTERAYIERFKSQRSSFDLSYWHTHSDELIRYSCLENTLGARMQEKFDFTCKELGYPLTSWYGAGSMAKAMMTRHLVKDHLDNRKPFRRYKREEDSMVSILPHTYFGGRFEIQAPGEYRPVYEYDIRSAYPAAYRFLPCLIHGDWSIDRVSGQQQLHPHTLYRVSYQIDDTDVWGPFPFRYKQRISYPNRADQHYVWGEELIAANKIWPLAAKHGDLGIYIYGSWRYKTRCDCRPFDWIDTVYQRRKQLGKDTAGYPLKLGMNACYGTLASVLGSKFDGERLEGWCDPRWAGLITAWTRARLLDALAIAGGSSARSVVMFATDAIYTTDPLSLDTTDVLGGWEEHYFENGGLIIQPGMYHFHGQGVKAKLKGRGIEYKDVQDHVEKLYEAYRSQGDSATCVIPLSPRYMGVRLMLHRNDIGGAHRWTSSTRELSFDPSSKRILREDGLWYPRTSTTFNPLEVGENYGDSHRRMHFLLNRQPYVADAAEIELRIAQMIDDAQPEGPNAL